MSQGQPDLGEQALSKVAELGISSQLDQVEDLQVDIRTDPLKLVQGEVESVAISGSGMVMQQDLRVDSLELETEAVSINPLSVLLGKIELTQPTTAAARVVLTEADLNRALASDYLRQKLQNLQLEIEGQPQRLIVEQAALHLQPEGKLTLNATFQIQGDAGNAAPSQPLQQLPVQQLSVTGKPVLRDQGQRISLDEILYAEAQGITLETATALFEQAMALLDLRRFELQGMALQLQSLEVKPGELVLEAVAEVSQLAMG